MGKSAPPPVFGAKKVGVVGVPAAPVPVVPEGLVRVVVPTGEIAPPPPQLAAPPELDPPPEGDGLVTVPLSEPAFEPELVPESVPLEPLVTLPLSELEVPVVVPVEPVESVPVMVEANAGEARPSVRTAERISVRDFIPGRLQIMPLIRFRSSSRSPSAAPTVSCRSCRSCRLWCRSGSSPRHRGRPGCRASRSTCRL